MNSFKNLLILIFMGVYAFGIAQDTDQVKKRGPADDYSRSSISYLLLDFDNEKYAHYLRDAIKTTKVPSKFDNNNLSKKIIKAPYVHQPLMSNSKNAEKIRKALVAEQYAIDIVKYWWKVQSNGTYSTRLIKERGFYDATDEEVAQLDATKVGRARLGDAGLKLIGNSYVLVIDVSDMKTMQDIYDEKDRKARKKAEKDKTEFVPVKRERNGFKAKVTTYLFKMNYPDTVQGYFDEAFIDEKTLDLKKLDKIFDQVYTPLKLVTIESQNIDATQPNPDTDLGKYVKQKTKEQLAAKIVNSGIIKSLSKIEKSFEAFRVKAPVTNENPIRAKIGKKEGLTHERRYFVWQYIGNSKGNVVARKKGVIRAHKVVDNRQDELGKTRESTFYQISGGKITEGMTLQERKDAGIGVGVGYGALGLSVRADFNVGQWANAPLKQWKLYGEFLTKAPEYSDVNVVEGTSITSTMENDLKYTETKLTGYLLKEYPFARNFHAGWAVGYSFETVSWKNEDSPFFNDRGSEQLSASGFAWQLKFGMNLISYNVQLIGTVGGYHYGNVTYKSGIEDEEDLDLEQKWSDIFPDKSGINVDLSIRINF